MPGISYKDKNRMSELQRENEREIAFVMNRLQQEGYTPERLKQVLFHAENFEKTHGSRLNRYVLQAVKNLLNKNK